MSIVEQPVDSIKSGNSFCDIPPSDVTRMTTNQPIEMELDAEKIQTQNGSTSTAINKDIDFEKLKMFDMKATQPMDIDEVNNIKAEKKENCENNCVKETEATTVITTSGETKTDETQLADKKDEVETIASKTKVASNMETSEEETKETDAKESVENELNNVKVVVEEKDEVIVKKIKEKSEEIEAFKESTKVDVKDVAVTEPILPNSNSRDESVIETLQKSNSIVSGEKNVKEDVEEQHTEDTVSAESISENINKNEVQKMEQDPSENNGDQEMVEPKEKAEAEEPTVDDEQTTATNANMTEQSAQADVVEDETTVTVQGTSQTFFNDENRYFKSGKIVELSRIAWTSNSDKQQYVRGCLWSPDGTCILTAVNMDGMHVMNLPSDLYSNENVSENRPLNKLESVINVKEGGTVYDYCWYPFMNSTMPETCCWLSSRQHCPIQLWDGFTGDLRGSYRGYDNFDEVEAAFSVAFTSDGEKVIGGYKKTLKIFDTKSPGREYSMIPIKQPCSCFAVQETQNYIIATGSWNCLIDLYDLRAPKLGSLVTFAEHSGGITWLKFAASGDSLFSGARKDNNLFEWDMRNFSKPIRQLKRNVQTNQRIYFDLSPGEKWLISGDTAGLVRIWDLKAEKTEEDFAFELHKDCCNGVGFHPSQPILATCSGQYHFAENVDATENTAEIYENSMIIWWVGDTSGADVGSKKGTGETRH